MLRKYICDDAVNVVIFCWKETENVQCCLHDGLDKKAK